MSFNRESKVCGPAWSPLLFLPGSVAAGPRQSFTPPFSVTINRVVICQLVPVNQTGSDWQLTLFSNLTTQGDILLFRPQIAKSSHL